LRILINKPACVGHCDLYPEFPSYKKGPV
jgi:hypothetical protein